MRNCIACKGSGLVDCATCRGRGQDKNGDECRSCDGDGTTECSTCEGSGQVDD